MLTVLCVHQGTEKYGSDKSFVAAVSALEAQPDMKTQILLPGEGSIVELIRDAQLPSADLRYIWVLRKVGFLKSITVGLPRNLLAVFKAIQDLKKYDVVYVNTAVIVDFMLAAILTRCRMIIHVREIPVGVAMKVIRQLLIFTKSQVIFNSHATAQAFDLPRTQPQSVVYNGFDAPAPFEKQLYDGVRPLRVLCIGRLNSWKGQEILVRACALLSAEDRDKLCVRIVGGVYKDQNHFRTNLENEISKTQLNDTIVIQDFIDDPSQEYIDADVVVVPSTLPEPFGRVAIEGMAYGGVIIASNHGGLSEIVVDGKTGCLVPPNDASSIAEALSFLIRNPEIVSQYSAAGKARFANVFTQSICDDCLMHTVRRFGPVTL